MLNIKVKPALAMLGFAVLAGFLLMPLNESRFADILIFPIGFMSAIFGWYTFNLQHVQSWKRGAIAGLFSAFIAILLSTTVFLISRLNSLPDLQFFAELFRITFLLLLVIGGLKFTIPLVAAGALAGQLANNHTQSKESST